MNNRLSTGVKIGYGFGTFGECLAMNTFYIYFLFFLTNAAGVSASAAGTISAIAVFWGAFTDLFAGAKSDSSLNPKGRRRPFMFKAAVPLGIVMFLMYTDFSGFSSSAKFIYFLAASLIFWLSLSFTDIPYLSLGSEISDDYEERNTIRAIANVLNYGGMIIASSGTLMLVVKFSGESGTADPKGWSAVGLIFGILILLAYWIAAIATKGKEPINTHNAIDTNVAKISFAKSCIEVLSIKPYRYIMLYTVFGYGAVLIFTSIYIYFLSYNMAFTEGQSAMYMLIYSIMVIIISTILAGIGTKIEKRTVVCASTFLVGLAMIIAKYSELTPITLYIIFFFFAIAISAYFVQIYSMVYDVCDLDQFISGGGREGIIISLFYFVGKVIGGIAMFAVGWILTYSGYDPSLIEQSAETLSGIATGSLLIPGIGFVIGAIAMLKYPINQKNFNALRQANVAKASDAEFSTDEFSKLL
jgi:glycoside/pentoside/hexuronide:cation symporter, GPH family